MAWVKIDDGIAQHPKVIRAGPLGLALVLAAICYANRYLTDGFIPKESVPLLLNFNGSVAPDILASKLVALELWEQAEGGYRIHDYLEHQRSKVEIEADRAQKVAAGQAGGRARAQAEVKRVLGLPLRKVSSGSQAELEEELEEKKEIKIKKEKREDLRPQFAFAPGVCVTENEYQKLIERFGEAGTKERIESLAFYINSKGKKYKSHYFTILSWERRHQKEQDNAKRGQPTGKSQGILPDAPRPPRALPQRYTPPGDYTP